MENEIVKDIKVNELFVNDSYVIPIYQRNYTWTELEIIQLIDDVYNATDTYYLGSLVVDRIDSRKYEVIDGQQRLTTLYLLLILIDEHRLKDKLNFEAREKSNRLLYDLNKITEREVNNRKLNNEVNNELWRGYITIDNYLKQQSDENSYKEKLLSKLEETSIVRVQVPKNIDLNHYFEIMNTRGEQLELHEIVKAKILGQLKDTRDKRIATLIWESCSDMEHYVQMSFPIDLRDKVFSGRKGDNSSNAWENLCEDIKDFNTLRDCITNNDNDVEEETDLLRVQLQDILKDERKIQNQDFQKGKEDKQRFQSIITFSNFLLQVNETLRLMKTTEHSDTVGSLDDGQFNLLLKEHYKNEEISKYFIFHLLKCRLLFDKYIIKRDFSGNYRENGSWSLKTLQRNEDKSAQYVNTASDNHLIEVLQASLRITYTSPKTMHWISLVLFATIKDEKVDIKDLLENYARSKATTYEETEFKIERIVYTYLDYLLYRDGNKYLSKEDIDHWEVQFRNSVEHFYPQHPTEGEIWGAVDLQSFGNLALITASGNSKFSNAPPAGKVDGYPSIVKQSLKLMIMSKMSKEDKSGWNPDKVITHNLEMVEILKKDLGK